MKKLSIFILLLTLFTISSFGQQFKASYESSVFSESFSGNVFVYLSKDNKEPKSGAVGIEKFPVYSVSVKNIKPGQTVLINDKAISYPVVLSDIERGDYYVQIVWDRNLGGRSIAESPGNLYNESKKISVTKDTNKVFSIVANKMIPKPLEFHQTEFVKELKAPSTLLSEFHQKPMTVNAVVILPKEYFTETSKKFPVLFVISGYGGNYLEYSGDSNPSEPIDNIPLIQVYLDGNCALGHSVYANSANNGPWGDALTTEFIPLLEKNFRTNGARLLTGHSSGGWTVLWLQTQYPKIFHGCWSSAPDPVDFRSFQKVNLYEDKNMFYDANGNSNLVATIGGFIPWGNMKNAYQMEHVVSRGEQMQSFNAVFSNKGKNGMPEQICNNETGEINAAVFEHWKKYDIALYLKNNWETVKSDLDGKIRISVGNQDNFLLNEAVRLLDTHMKTIESKMQFSYYPGDHFTVFTPEYKEAGSQFLKEKYLEWLANNK